MRKKGRINMALLNQWNIYTNYQKFEITSVKLRKLIKHQIKLTHLHKYKHKTKPNNDEKSENTTKSSCITQTRWHNINNSKSAN